MSLINTKKKRTAITLHKVVLGKKAYEIPVAKFLVESDAPTFVITAGLDGDEYTGIEAAYQLIEIFTKTTPSSNVIIVPILNIPGFYAQTSANPLDLLYPKHIFPGKKNGQPTEQLMSWLATELLPDNSVWIDLHSGSLKEKLTPFIWTYASKNHQINSRIQSAIAESNSKMIIHSHTAPQKIHALAKRNIGYVMIEGGESGEARKDMIDLQVQWVTSVIKNVLTSSIKSFTAYTAVDEYSARHSGLWYPTKKTGEAIRKGEILGQVSSLGKQSLETIKAKNDGLLLWQQSTVAVVKNTIVIGIGTSPMLFKIAR